VTKNQRFNGDHDVLLSLTMFLPLMPEVKMAVNDHSDTAVEGRHTMEEEPGKHLLADWKNSAALFVRQELFNKKQFVSDEELVHGGMLQTMVCNHTNASGATRSRMFWDDLGGK
jgi:hypothetical protein